MPAIEAILKTATEAAASDVHITVGIPPKMRVNGKLHTMNFPRMLPADTLEILLNIMTEAQRETFEEKGELDISFSIPETGRYRVNAYKQRGAVALAIRLVGAEVKSAKELGIPAAVIDLYQRKRGLVLATGPAGCGKTTTLAALIDKINSDRDAHVLTLEEPIEYLHPHKNSMVNQREIGSDSESYASALQAALRENPDVILVGELKDLDTIRLAISAAETGHLVLATFSTVDTVSVIDRIIDAFPIHQQQQARIRLAGVLSAVVAQQLIPTADDNGRVAAFEVLLANRAVKNLISEGKTSQLAAAMKTADQKNGIVSMDVAIGRLCEEGKISKQTAVRFAQDPESMAKRFIEQ